MPSDQPSPSPENPSAARFSADKPPPNVRTDGSCINVTLAALEDGVGSGKPMGRPALEIARGQAIDLLGEVIETYQTAVAIGEVGAEGSARASSTPPIADQCPTGLLYGRVQSGKTLAMITFSALAIDNGFRVIVVLTSDNIKLVDQTASRFSALDAIVLNSTQTTSWAADAKHIEKNLPHVGLVVVCAKNQSHLATLIDFLEEVGAASYPALVLDDEADQATPDTTVAARAAGRPNAPKFSSTINRRTVRNDRSDEEGRSVREVLHHHLFLQVTATPYALLLQNSDSPLKPKFTVLLRPGEGYTGGEHFFSSEHIDSGLAPLSFVRDEESDELERGVKVAPPGLVEALAMFLVAAGAQVVADPLVRARSQNFLCHTSQKRMEHEKVSGLIRGYLDKVGDELRNPIFGGETSIHFGKAHKELEKTLPEIPALNLIVADLRVRLPKRQVIVVNSDGGNAEFTRGINFIVGGNILGRGLTIDNLLVTYYLRRAKVSQMDTMLQHARMFGYRAPLMPYTRVFVPERLALRFHRIHMAEQNLRNLLADPDRRSRIPVQVSEGLRATRPGVLDMGAILAYTPGQHVYPAAPLTTGDAAKDHGRAKEAAEELLGRTIGEVGELVAVSLTDIDRLLTLLPFDRNDEDTWDPKALRGLLKANAVRFAERGWLYCRTMRRTKIVEGALGGPELKQLRSKGAPVLCVFLDIGRKYAQGGRVYDDEFTYPTFVLPDQDDMPAHLFNATE
jgi:hypothetical protein